MLRAAAWIACVAVTLPLVLAQSPATLRPNFEVVSIKPCKAGDIVPGRGGSEGGGSLTRESFSPGRLNLRCWTVKSLVRAAYVQFGSGSGGIMSSIPIEGGPAWIDSERYDIQTKAEGNPGLDRMLGVLMRTLLEDRFQLKVNRKTRAIPVYVLTVAKGGPKFPAFQEGTCVPLPIDDLLRKFPPPEPPPLPSGQRYCTFLGDMKGSNRTLEAQGATLDQFARLGLAGMDRPVMNKTGLKGRFNLNLEYAPDQTFSQGFRDGDRPGGDPAFLASDPAGPSIFTALQQQLGLKLEPSKGPGEYLVIHRVEKPSAN